MIREGGKYKSSGHYHLFLLRMRNQCLITYDVYFQLGIACESYELCLGIGINV